jgi:rhomboid protease GluP
MPSEKQQFSFPGYSANELLLYAYGTFQELEWTVKYAGPVAIVAYTPKNWNKYGDEVMVEVTDGGIVVTSSLIHNESFDMMKKNKKHINDFIAMFEKVKLTEADPAWVPAIEKIREQTIEVVKEQEKQNQEIDKVMNFSGSNLYVTYALIFINILVFVLMAIDGAGILRPDGYTQIKWGSNYASLTLTGDWWRLITCVFIHFGILHLIMNMYALYMAGVYLEPMLGKVKYTVAYLATGLVASVVSLWWHKDGVNSAGASGAIFGMYGLFLGLLFTNLIPKKMRIALLQTIGIMVVFNIVYGMSAMVDNAAHIGGLLSGIIIGLFYYLFLKQNKPGPQWIAAVIVGLVAIAIAWAYIDKSNDFISPEMAREAHQLKRSISYKDGKRFYLKKAEISGMEEVALSPLRDTSLTWQELSAKLNEHSKSQWEKAKQMFKETESYKISDEDHQEAALWIKYADARLEEITIIEKIATNFEKEDYAKLSAVREKIGSVITRLNELN